MRSFSFILLGLAAYCVFTDSIDNANLFLLVLVINELLEKKS